MLTGRHRQIAERSFCDLNADLSGGYRQEIPPLLRPSPEFVVRLVDGKQLLLSSFRGRIV
jgi:hypothetical protein